VRRHLCLWLLIAALTVAGHAGADTVSHLVGRISQTSYQSYLDDTLYTHDGDDRGWGPEHDLARDNIYDQFLSFGLQTALDPFQYNGSTYHNVVGVLTGHTRPDDYYVIGAHYDSVNNPGADDNASGVAGVLEIARVASMYDFEATIIFIAFDREEQGLVGSEAWVAEHTADTILGMVSMDMIAYDPNDNSRAHLYSTSASDSLRQALQSALAERGGITADMPPDLPYSDHAPFEDAGFPAALLIEYDHSSNPYYHKAGDSVDTPDYIDYDYATRMTTGVAGWVADAGGAHPVPEPGTLVLVAMGVLAIRRRCRRAA
jgi:Zn-dependent M28 family amino/carboxypeptidase